jgi:Transposase DDE domain/Transposase domain (DUF772)
MPQPRQPKFAPARRVWENYKRELPHFPRESSVSLGLAQRQGNLLDDLAHFCGRALAEGSIYAVLHRERDRLFPDEMFADLFSGRGRRSVPASVVAVVMVLQRLEGLSDREAVERYTFDARWRYAAGVGGYDGGGPESFAHTVLVDMRARLAGSKKPRRIFEVTVEAATKAGLVGEKRVLDSTPLYDAVATMDTVTLLRSAMRGLLKAAEPGLEAELRVAIKSGDDYASSSKPQIDWDDQAARDALIASRARDAYACLALLDGRQLGREVAEAAELLARVVGQDLEETSDGTLAIARKVAKDRVISTVDPEARHGRKTSARSYDGYKGHISLDPDSEVITATTVTAANQGDAGAARQLMEDLGRPVPPAQPEQDEEGGPPSTTPTTKKGVGRKGKKAKERAARAAARAALRAAQANARKAKAAKEKANNASVATPSVYGDAAYGSGELLAYLQENGIDARVKAQPPSAPGGVFTKDRFVIDLGASTVTCPAGNTVPISFVPSGTGTAHFGEACAACPLREACTTAKTGRTVGISSHEELLQAQRARCADPGFAADYKATRPKVERKLAHLMRRRHGGRRARVRGKQKVDADFNLLAAAQNLGRLAVLGLRSTPDGWVAAAI